MSLLELGLPKIFRIGLNEFNILEPFMVSKSILFEKSTLPFKLSFVAIIDYLESITGAYIKPVEFNGPNTSGLNENGYGDYLSIKVVRIEKKLRIAIKYLYRHTIFVRETVFIYLYSNDEH